MSMIESGERFMHPMNKVYHHSTRMSIAIILNNINWLRDTTNKYMIPMPGHDIFQVKLIINLN
jgi:hypothetical protein